MAPFNVRILYIKTKRLFVKLHWNISFIRLNCNKLLYPLKQHKNGFCSFEAFDQYQIQKICALTSIALETIKFVAIHDLYWIEGDRSMKRIIFFYKKTTMTSSSNESALQRIHFEIFFNLIFQVTMTRKWNIEILVWDLQKIF